MDYTPRFIWAFFLISCTDHLLLTIQFTHQEKDKAPGDKIHTVFI